MERQKAIFDLLTTSFLFCGLPLQQLQQLAQKTKLHSFSTGYPLMEEGINNDKVILIISGLVKVYKTNAEGKEIFIAIEKEGNYIGINHLEDKPSSATIEAIQPIKTLIFYKKDVLEIFKNHPDLWEKAYRIVVTKLEEYREFHSIRLSNNLSQRTYLILQFLAKFSKSSAVFLSQETIASIVGATRPRVTETLHALQNEKKIIISPKKITVFT